MTENKQITIYELLPLLKRGWVAMDKDGNWHWYEEYPLADSRIGEWSMSPSRTVVIWACFNIAPFDGDWKDSLMEVK